MGRVRRPRLTAAKVFARCPPCLRMNKKGWERAPDCSLGSFRAAISVRDTESIRSMIGVASGSFSNTPPSSAFQSHPEGGQLGQKTAHSHQDLLVLALGQRLSLGESQWW